jgi:radical SAM superfamily enzyme YgiQ (UPF0313 family)
VSDIVLTTFNARYTHTAFGLRCLLANLGPLQPRATLVEFDLRQPPNRAAETVLAASPRIVGIGVYIWNLTLVRQLVEDLRRRTPGVVVVLGGPEAGYAPDDEPAVRAADFTVTGEGEIAFRDLCAAILAGHPPPGRRIRAPRPDIARLALPYDLYTDDDIANRTLYVEATRGCPFRCEYCISSLDPGVRHVQKDRFLAAMDRLLDRGALRFKFVDRSFNAIGGRALEILDFFLARMRPGLLLHFEIVPDRLSEPMLERFARFPAGSLHLELGIQSLHAPVNRRVGREQDGRLALAWLRRLRAETRAALHTDLLIGLPGEDLSAFGLGFDRLLRSRPHEIQINLLKRLRGTALDRHARRWDMAFRPDPPYEVLSNRLIAREDMRRLAVFARFWGRYYNSGHFTESLPLLWAGKPSPFRAFLAFSDSTAARFGRTHGLALAELAVALHDGLVAAGVDRSEAAAAVRLDYHRKPRRERLPF